MTQKNIIEDMKERFDLEKIKDLIKNNMINFKVEEQEYRVRILTRKERNELELEKQKYLNKLLREGDFDTEEVLIQNWKKKGIDIREMEKEFEDLSKNEKSHNLKLGELLKNKASEKECQIYKEKIENIQQKKLDLNIKRYQYLAGSMESQLLNFHYKYLTYLCLEKKEKENWAKYFKNFKEYENCEDDKLIEEASYNTTLLYT